VSSLILGDGDAATVTGNVVFEASYQALNNLTINAIGTTFTLGSALTVNNTAIASGTMATGNDYTINTTFQTVTLITKLPVLQILAGRRYCFIGYKYVF